MSIADVDRLLLCRELILCQKLHRRILDKLLSWKSDQVTVRLRHRSQAPRLLQALIQAQQGQQYSVLASQSSGRCLHPQSAALPRCVELVQWLQDTIRGPASRSDGQQAAASRHVVHGSDTGRKSHARRADAFRHAQDPQRRDHGCVWPDAHASRGQESESLCAASARTSAPDAASARATPAAPRCTSGHAASSPRPDDAPLAHGSHWRLPRVSLKCRRIVVESTDMMIG